MNNEQLQEVIVTAQKIYPGRSWEQLSDEEKLSVFKDWKSQRNIGAELVLSPSPEGRNVGPLDVYMAPNWGEVAASAASKALGGYMVGKANRGQERGRQATADMITRRDAIDSDVARQQAMRDEELRRQYLQSIIGGYQP